MRGLQGGTAIVTGAARGIGRAVAQRLYDEGMRVMLADVDQAAGQQTAHEIGEEDKVRFTECDVCEKLDVRNLLATTTDAFGPVAVLVNNAAVLGGGEFLKLKEDDFDHVLRVNLKGAFLLSQAVAKQMVKEIEDGRPAGSIVNISSVNAIFALAEEIPYSISKAAIAQLTKASALALAPYGIRVNAVGPGSVETDVMANLAKSPAAKKAMLSRTPLGRMGEPQEIASIVAFLASEDASYITGQTVYADGGRLPLNTVVAAD
ncbi:MAG: SDR family NAD(P)-dependent oxidoreductase [Pseudomonadota bacterium]